MCFSATASFVAGVSLSAVGVVTLKKAKNTSEKPFAAIPLIFGIQQCIEGFVWLSFGWNNGALNFFATQFFYFFSNVWWPVFVPLALISIETVRRRKQILFSFQAVGIFVGAYFLYFMMLAPVTSKVLNHCIVYGQAYPHSHRALLAVLYVVATSISCFVSSKRIVKVLGILLLASLAPAYIFYSTAFVSVWCFFAAILSFVIYLYFRRPDHKIVRWPPWHL